MQEEPRREGERAEVDGHSRGRLESQQQRAENRRATWKKQWPRVFPKMTKQIYKKSRTGVDPVRERSSFSIPFPGRAVTAVFSVSRPAGTQ